MVDTQKENPKGNMTGEMKISILLEKSCDAISQQAVQAFPYVARRRRKDVLELGLNS